MEAHQGVTRFSMVAKLELRDQKGQVGGNIPVAEPLVELDAINDLYAVYEVDLILGEIADERLSIFRWVGSRKRPPFFLSPSSSATPSFRPPFKLGGLEPHSNTVDSVGRYVSGA